MAKYAGDTWEFEHEGFTIKAAIHYDDAQDISWLGEFSDEPGANAIDHHATDGQHQVAKGQAESERDDMTTNGEWAVVNCDECRGVSILSQTLEQYA